jgi:hypothetical protein
MSILLSIFGLGKSNIENNGSDHLSGNGNNQTSGSPVIPELAQVYPLPCTENEASVPYRDGQIVPDQRRLHVRGHIVVSLHRMNVPGIALRYKGIENCLEICPDVGICVFIDRETRAGMENHDMRDPDTATRNVGYPGFYLTGNDVKPARSRRQADLTLRNGHCSILTYF